MATHPNHTQELAALGFVAGASFHIDYYKHLDACFSSGTIIKVTGSFVFYVRPNSNKPQKEGHKNALQFARSGAWKLKQ